MKPGTDYVPHEAFLRVWSDSDWAGNVKDRKSQMSLKIEVGGCPLHSASRKQKAQAHTSGDVDPRIPVVHGTGSSNRTLDSAAARGICRRDFVGTIRHLSTTFLGYGSW